MSAGPPTTSYRARKFVRRHRAGVITVTALVLSLGAGIVGTSVEKSRAQAQTRLADARLDQVRYEADKASTVLDLFWYGLVHGHPSMTGENQTKRVLDMFLESDEGIQRLFDRSPGAEAAVHTSLGRAFLFLGEDRAALHQYLLSRSIQNSDANRQPLDVFVTVAGLLQATRRTEGPQAAQKYRHEALLLAREILAERVPELAESVDALIDLAQGQGGDAEEAIARLDEIMQAFPKSLHYGNEAVVIARLGLEVGGALREQGRDVSDSFFRELEAKARELLEVEDITFQTFLWILASVQLMPVAGNRLDEHLEEHFEEALRYARELSSLSTGPLPPEHWLRPEAKRLEGVALFGLADFAQAEVALRNAWETLAAVDPQNDRQRETAMSARAWYARCLAALGRPQDARAAYADLRAVLEEPLTPATRELIAAVGTELAE